MNSRRLGCLTLPGITAALLTLALVAGVGFAKGGALFSPGGLNAQNVNGKVLGGVNTHAELSDQCGACHTAPWSSVGMTTQCLACHAEIQQELETTESFHGSILEFSDPIQCRDCHTEHIGPEGLLTSFNDVHFKHAVVGFALDGHQTTYKGDDFACADCHGRPLARFEASACEDCHQAAEPAFMQRHTATFGSACRDCHDGVDTYGADFDHGKTGFPLIGEHREESCGECHRGARSIADLQGTPNTCFDCHSREDEHNGQFGQNCGVCHTPTDWEAVSFNHSVTGFDLIGEHREAECQDCHPGNQYIGTPAECVACHEEDDPHGDSFGDLGCENCHTPEDWEEVSFAHPLPVAQDCTGCHEENTPANHYPGQCSNCHGTEAWLPATFNHVGALNCLECHTETAPPNHFPGQCSDCHTTEAWTPSTFSHETASATDCMECHAKDRPANHYPGQCSACHSTVAWLPANFDHTVAGATDCTECHLNDRPPGHYPGQCSACHSTRAWLPADFNHAVAGATDCFECHLDDRPANHYNGQCSACHSTEAWLPANFNHSAAGATNCIDCHSGDAPPGHYSGQCSACHNTNAWLPASFNHSAAGATNCINCHLGDRPANHYDGQCSTCHTTDAWLPASFDHTFPTNHGGAGGECSRCHPNNPPGYSCYACHEHDPQEIKKKHEEKGIFDYQDCIACHPTGEKGDD